MGIPFPYLFVEDHHSFFILNDVVEQFFVVFRLDSVSCYVSYSNEYFNLLGRSVTNLLYQNRD